MFLWMWLVLPLLKAEEHNPPVFDKELEEVHGVEDCNVTLLCKARADGNVNYTWRHQSNNPTLTVSSGVLRIQELACEDEGTYTCHARNNFGLTSKIFDLKVNHGKTPELLFPEVTYESHRASTKNITLKCHVIPEECRYNYTWKHENGAAVEPGGAYEFSEGGSTLVVPTPMESTYRYFCQAANRHGASEEMTHVIKILDDRPENGSIEPRVIGVDVDSVTFEFSASSSRLTLLVLEARIDGDVKAIRSHRHQSAETQKFTVGQLKPGGFYVISFLVNFNGSERTTENATVNLLPPEPLLWINAKRNTRLNVGWHPRVPVLTKNNVDHYELRYFKTSNESLLNLETDLPTEIYVKVRDCYGCSRTFLLDTDPVGVPSNSHWNYCFVRVRTKNAAGYGKWASLLTKQGREEA